MKISWSPLSTDRLTSILDYIAQDKPNAAINTANTIFKAVERLKVFPQSGRVVPELENPKYREILVKNYRVIYSIKEDVIYIITIRHQIQLLKRDNIK